MLGSSTPVTARLEDLKEYEVYILSIFLKDNSFII